MKYYLSILLSICFINSFSQNNNAIQKFVATSGFENASVGFCLKEISGKEITSYNKNTALTPASTLKIVTTAIGLELLGEDYKFETKLSIDKANPQHIIIRGNGDPTLGSQYLNDSPEAFLDIWVEKIRGAVNISKPLEIEIDDRYFGYTGVSRKWLQEDLGNYYAAGAYGISIFDNTYKLFFNTMDADNLPQILRTEPEMKEIVFLNTLTTNKSGKDNGYINGEPFSNNRKLVGDIPANRKSFSIKGDIPDPGLYLGQTLAKKLTQNNMLIGSVYTARSDYFRSSTPQFSRLIRSEEEIIYTQNSLPLKKIIRVINEKSNNHYTEHLIRAIGASNADIIPYVNPLDEGINKIKNLLASQGLDADALFMYDGCGLAPSNKISPQLLCDILIYMQDKSKYKESFFASLPKAGREGTVRNLLKGTRLEGKIFVKSGSIADVQCFAGYYVDGNKKYAFSVMVNNYTSLRKNVVKSIESLLLATFP